MTHFALSKPARAPIDYEGHIINREINRRNRLVGGHTLLGNVEILPNENIRYIGENGVYEAKVGIRDPSRPTQFIVKGNNNGASTMFPKEWTKEKLMEEVDYAFENRAEVISNSGQRTWKGTTPSGIKVEGYLFPKTTVYPIR